MAWAPTRCAYRETQHDRQAHPPSLLPPSPKMHPVLPNRHRIPVLSAQLALRSLSCTPAPTRPGSTTPPQFTPVVDALLALFIRLANCLRCAQDVALEGVCALSPSLRKRAYRPIGETRSSIYIAGINSATVHDMSSGEYRGICGQGDPRER
ncbi:hypothetical protein OH77DRAFT_1417195 [Trametes cingulata]|nr:hypothetical protein OH77DRAFT_1417195 [Trametes cingulata]